MKKKVCRTGRLLYAVQIDRLQERAFPAITLKIFGRKGKTI